MSSLWVFFSEKCRNLRIKSYAYSNTDNCRVHWACNLGKATATCCAEGSRYVPYRGCVEDPKCKDVCPPTFHQEGPCDTRMIFNKPNKFEQYVTGFGWVEMPCAPGTQFDPNTCQCSLHDSFLPGKRKTIALYLNTFMKQTRPQGYYTLTKFLKAILTFLLYVLLVKVRLRK